MTSFPASLTTRIVKGRFVTYPDGKPDRGSVRIVLDTAMQGPTDDTIVAPFDITQQFNESTNGQVSFLLPANNDPQWTPAVYRIVITFSTGQVHRQKLLVGYDSIADIDLSDVLNIPSGELGDAYIVRSLMGVPGGIPTLDENGKVEASQLPPGNGGDISVSWDEVTDKPSVFPADPTTVNVDWDDVNNKPSVFPVDPSTIQVDWLDVTGKPVTFAPSAHTHSTSDINSLDTALASKATQTQLTTGLAGKSDTNHTHAFSTITGKPSTYPHDPIDWDELVDKPTTFPHDPITWDEIEDKPDITPGTGGVAYVWTGTEYVQSTSTIYVGPVDPLTIASPESGSLWYQTDDDVPDPGDGGGSVGDGQRVTAAGQVGYVGATHIGSHVLNPGDPLPSELQDLCRWDDTVFRVNNDSNDVVIDGYRINAGIDGYGTNLTIKNCVIVPPVGTAFFGVLGRAGDITVQDTTIIGAGTTGESGQCVSLDGGGVMTVQRCDLSGYQDAIGITNGLVSQVYIHDSALAGSFHSDGIQIFGGGSGGVTIEDSLIDITGPAGASTDGAHQNACVYTDAPSGPATGVTVNNCQLNGGAYELMLSAAPQDVHITNCDFGPVDSSGFGEVAADPGTQFVEWFNNRDSNGSLISQPAT